MKMKIDRICAVVALTYLMVIPASAQVDKSVEVTQAFIPQVERATKPMLEPDMTDDAYITPDIDYSITPISIHSEIDSTPYKPVEMNYWEYRRQNNYYAKLGGGYPFRSVADLYASKSEANSGYVMGFVNHNGDYSDIKSDYGVDQDATSYHIGVGSTAGLYLDKRVLEGAVRYDRDEWSRYASECSVDERPLYQSLRFDGFFGDNYSDWSRWNMSLRAGVDYMWSGADYDGTTYGAKFDMGREAWNGHLKFGADFRGVYASDSYVERTFGAFANYSLVGDVARFSVGMSYYHDYIEGDGSNYFIPQVSFECDLADEQMVTYLSLDGEMGYNDFASLVDRNPYLVSGMYAPKSSLDYDLMLGVKGLLAQDRLMYDLHIGYSSTLNDLYWAYTERSDYNGYLVDCADLQNFNLAVNMRYSATPKLSFEVDYKVSNYSDSDDISWKNGLPTNELRLGGDYKLGRFSIGADCEILSRREFSAYYTNRADVSTIEIPTTFDLGVDMEYKTKGRTTIFVDLNNLINQDLYNYARYREYGIGAVAGVKILF